MKHWEDFLKNSDPDGSILRFCEALYGFCNKHIPQKTIFMKAVSHPWLNDKCVAAVTEKALAAGNAEF